VKYKSIITIIAAWILVSTLAFAQKPPSSSKDLLVVVKDGRYGYIDYTGKIVIQPQFLWGGDFHNGFAPVYLCSREVWIDPSGNVSALPPPNGSGLRPVRRAGKVGFVDRSGTFKIDAIYDDALPFSDGAAAVELHGLWGFIGLDGHEIVPPIYKSASYFREGVGQVESDHGSLSIDKSGAVLAASYEYLAGVTSEGRIPVSRNEKNGYLDLHGKIAIPLEYESAGTFSNGLAPVEKGGRWGYIDQDGQMSIPFIFDEAGPFASGLAPVKIGGDSGFIDKTGKFAFHLAFEQAPGFLTEDADGMLTEDADISRFSTKANEFGYVNTSGKVIWGPTKERPDHWPLHGWSNEGKAESCKGIPEAMRQTVLKLPPE
jgi:hypothetical protein